MSRAGAAADYPRACGASDTAGAGGSFFARFRLLALLLAVLPGMTHAALASAVRPDERMADPVLEAQATQLYKALRCVVCQNQTIADSDADIATDMRALIRHELAAGKSPDAIKSYLHSRYGDFILMRPPLRGATAFLWLAPLIALGAGIFLMLRQATAENGEENGGENEMRNDTPGREKGEAP